MQCEWLKSCKKLLAKGGILTDTHNKKNKIIKKVIVIVKKLFNESKRKLKPSGSRN